MRLPPVAQRSGLSCASAPEVEMTTAPPRSTPITTIRRTIFMQFSNYGLREHKLYKSEAIVPNITAALWLGLLLMLLVGACAPSATPSVAPVAAAHPPDAAV